MMEIVRVNEENMCDIIEFIENYLKVKDIDLEVIKNASFVSDGKEVIGLLSFEKFCKIGLVRYFVFKRIVDSNIVFDLLDSVIEDAREKGITSLTTIANNEGIKRIFKELGFFEIESKYVYIEEENLLNTKYKDSSVLSLEII